MSRSNEPFFQAFFRDSVQMPGGASVGGHGADGGILINKIMGQGRKIAFYLSVDKARFRVRFCRATRCEWKIAFFEARLGMYKTQEKR
jgi:3-hydroxymyristoyl/3-hydroxydecanoyl-(acyl carrier protein) dehydratase